MVVCRPAHFIASTGPHSEECGEGRSSRRRRRRQRGFNGAALRRVRRATIARRHLDWLMASTGPHSEECGELPACFYATL